MSIVRRYASLVLVASFAVSGVLAATVQAKVYTLEQWIAPLECVEEEIADGVSIITYLTPEECDELLNPEEENPENPTTPPVSPTTPTDTPGSSDQTLPLLATGSSPSYRELQLSGLEPSATGTRVTDTIRPANSAGILNSGLVLVLLAGIVCWLLWQVAFREHEVFKRLLAKRKR